MTYEDIMQHLTNRMGIQKDDIPESNQDVIAQIAEILSSKKNSKPKSELDVSLYDAHWENLLIDLNQQEIETDKMAHEISIDEFPKIEIIPLGDLHVGHKCMNYDKLMPVIEYIENTPHAFTFFVGDLAETATKQSIGKGMYEENEHIPKQLEILETILKPLAKKNKIWGLLPGNHEFRVEGLVGINTMEWLARLLEVPYFGYQGYMHVNVGNTPYTIWASHGKSGAMTYGGKINSAQKQKEVHLCDISVSGHIHERTYSFRNYFTIDPETKKVVKNTQHFITVCGFLDYFGAYPEMKALSPTLIKPIKISLYKDHKFIRVE